MKKILLISVVVSLASCENVKVNEHTIDSAGDKLQKNVKETVDTVASRIDRWEDSLDRDEDTTR